VREEALEPWAEDTDLDGMEVSGVMVADIVDRMNASGMQTAWVEVPELVGHLDNTHCLTRTRRTSMLQADGVAKRLAANMALHQALDTQQMVMQGLEVICVSLETCPTIQTLCSRCPLYRDWGCAGLYRSRSTRWQGWSERLTIRLLGGRWRRGGVVIVCVAAVDILKIALGCGRLVSKHSPNFVVELLEVLFNG
jgi:hypothetical protein